MDFVFLGFMAAMIIAGLVVGKLAGKKLGKAEFDERQQLARGKAYKAGFYTLLVGLLARFGFGSILSMQNSAWGMQGFWDNMSGMGGMSAAFRFPIIFADILCILGGIVIIGGVALAIIWKKRGQQ